MRPLQTLWSVEKGISDKSLSDPKTMKKIEKNAQLLGNVKFIPVNLRGMKVDIGKADVEKVLKAAGYEGIGSAGWTRWITSKCRFHATIMANGSLMIHHDRVLESGKHLASEHKVNSEKIRIQKNFVPVLESDFGNSVYKKSEMVLSLAKQREALEELKKKKAAESA